VSEDNKAPSDFSDEWCFLIEDLQNSFGVRFDEGELGEVARVGKLYSLLLTKLGEQPMGEDLEAVAVRLLSQSLQRLTPETAACLNASSSLKNLLPWWKRRSLWERLQADCRFVLPPLERSRWVGRLIFPVSLLAAIWGAAGQVWPATGEGVQRTGGGFSIWLAFTIALVYLTKPLKTQFPSGLQTLGDLGRNLVRHNFGKLASEGGGFDPAQAWTVYRHFVALYCSYSELEIQPGQHFVDDLGY
jgi:hypothetical protein